MNRGMLILSKEEITQISEAIATMAKNATTTIPQELPIRLQAAASASEDPVSVLLSEESAEAMLDALPAPQVSTLRTKCTNFLYQLRNPHEATR